MREASALKSRESHRFPKKEEPTRKSQAAAAGSDCNAEEERLTASLQEESLCNPRWIPLARRCGSISQAAYQWGTRKAETASLRANKRSLSQKGGPAVALGVGPGFTTGSKERRNPLPLSLILDRFRRRRCSYGAVVIVSSRVRSVLHLRHAAIPTFLHDQRAGQ